MLEFVLVIAVIISSCVFGSISDFSEKDIKDKENVIFNSSFEDGKFNEQNMPEHWMTLDNNTDYIFWDDVISRSGGKSLKIEYPDKKVNIVSETFPINSEYIYYTKCFLKTNYHSNHQIYIRFLAFNEKGKRVNKFSEKVYPGEEWTKGELTTGFFNSSARFGRIIISIPSKDDKTFWIDDIESFKVYRIQK